MEEKYETQKREKVKVGKVKEEWKEDERKVDSTFLLSSTRGGKKSVTTIRI